MHESMMSDVVATITQLIVLDEIGLLHERAFRVKSRFAAAVSASYVKQ